jgi:hypothetical protein
VGLEQIEKEHVVKPAANRDGVCRTDVLLPQLVNDNREALEELFSRYRGRLYNTAFRVLGQTHESGAG